MTTHTHTHGSEHGARRSWGSYLALPLILLIRAYQLLVSPLSPPSCRFYPSCSAYAVTALQRYGPVKGTWLAVWRLLRCNPWNPGGVDHVPQRVERTRGTGGAARQGPPQGRPPHDGPD